MRDGLYSCHQIDSSVSRWQQPFSFSLSIFSPSLFPVSAAAVEAEGASCVLWTLSWKRAEASVQLE